MTDEDLYLLEGPRPPWWRPFKRRRWDRAAFRRDNPPIDACGLADLLKVVYPPETIGRLAYCYHPSTWFIHEETKLMDEQTKSGVFQVVVRDQDGDPIFVERIGHFPCHGSVFLCETAWDEESDDPCWAGRQFTPGQARELAAALLNAAALADAEEGTP